MASNTIDQRERWDSAQETARVAAESQRASIWTSVPAIVKKHNANGTVEVQMTIKQRHINSDGSAEWMDYPVIKDIPIQYPGGGGASWTFPVKEGDEVLLCCASRSIDNWWKNGGVQEQAAPFRMHHPTDSFAIPGFRSQPRKLGDVSMGAAQLRTDDGGMVIEFDPSEKKITIKSPNNPVSIEGDLYVTGEIRAKVGSRNINLSTHIHSGIVRGSQTTDPPVENTLLGDEEDR